MPNDEWITPPNIIEMARDTMGSIDLDPASSEEAQKIVKATIYYTIKDNALAMAWWRDSDKNIWLNPPCSQPKCFEFITCLISAKINSGGQAILLINNCTETSGFQLALSNASAIAFPAKRLSFLQGGVVQKCNRQGQVLFYFGDRVFAFCTIFSEIGKTIPLRLCQ